MAEEVVSLVKVSKDFHRRTKGPGRGKLRRNPKRNRIKVPKLIKSHQKTVLGICPYCRKKVYKITENTMFGRKPKWVHTDKGNFYHIHCWKLRERSRPRRTNLKYTTPQTPLGQVEAERSDSEE